MLTIFDNLDHFQQSWPLLTILTIFHNPNNFWQFWNILKILAIFTFFLQFLQFEFFFTILTIFDNWRQFSQFRQLHLPFWKLKRQSWRLVTFETLITILTILTIENLTMTIFVTWQLIVTLDSIRNSCNVCNFRFVV